MAQVFIQAQKFRLAGSGVSSTATSIVLQSFTTPDGTTITNSDIGTTNWGTLEPGTSKEEIISFTGVTQNVDGTATLTGCTRGLKFKTDYTADPALRQSHAGGSIFVLTNNPQLYENFLSADNDETITGKYTFDTANWPEMSDNTTSPVDDEDLATKKYVDDTSGGSPVSMNRVVIEGTAGEVVAAGDFVYFDETDDEWKLTDASASATSESIYLGIAQGAGTDGNPITGGVLVEGLDSNQAGLSAGDLYYLADSAGAIANAPGTKEVEVGYALNATEIYFRGYFKHFLTEDQQDALAGTSGIPSSTNLFVTDDDVDAAATANKIARRNATGDVTVPASPTADTDAASKGYVDTEIENVNKKVDINTGQVTFSNTNAEETLYTISVPGDYLDTDNAIRFDIPVSDLQMNGGGALTTTLRLKYGATTITTITLSTATATLGAMDGYIKGYIAATGATNSQKGYMEINTTRADAENFSANYYSVRAVNNGTATEDSTGALNLVVTVQFSVANGANAITTEGIFVDQIA